MLMCFNDDPSGVAKDVTDVARSRISTLVNPFDLMGSSVWNQPPRFKAMNLLSI